VSRIWRKENGEKKTINGRNDDEWEEVAEK
jgi:hypothetical protein